MNCADTTALLPEYIRRRLPAAQEATVRAHLAACLACAAAYEEELAFGSLAHATDSTTPPLLMARVMAGVRAEPRQMPAFRVRPLNFTVVFAFAFALAFALGGLTVAALSLWSISPLIADALAARRMVHRRHGANALARRPLGRDRARVQHPHRGGDARGAHPLPPILTPGPPAVFLTRSPKPAVCGRNAQPHSVVSPIAPSAGLVGARASSRRIAG